MKNKILRIFELLFLFACAAIIEKFSNNITLFETFTVILLTNIMLNQKREEVK